MIFGEDVCVAYANSDESPGFVCCTNCAACIGAASILGAGTGEPDFRAGSAGAVLRSKSDGSWRLF